MIAALEVLAVVFQKAADAQSNLIDSVTDTTTSSLGFINHAGT
jgi:uncharacterized protein with FMN-binding domain